jgi:hypothetical protein
MVMMNRVYVYVYVYVYCCERARQLGKSGSLEREVCVEDRGYSEVLRW